MNTTTARGWQGLIEEAESHLAEARLVRAFTTAFRALEVCYGEAANLPDRAGADQFKVIVRKLVDQGQLGTGEKRLAHHLADARNLVAHGYGFEPSPNEVKRCIGYVRRLCGRFGRTVANVMTKPVETAQSDEPIGLYIEKMRTSGLSYFPVVDDEGRVVGTLDEWSLIRAIEREEGLLDLDEPVEAYMSSEPMPTVGPNVSLEAASREMRRKDSSALLIVADQRPTGIVTAFDLVHHAR